ncbi:MAG TPA: UvrD-helicase domain-containing protein, partial [Candidatus Bathyarchaeia archaeon]|nr:UvrD-helicase domain-containing protein [Candidatus Bathyarchaeia archaeon]
MRHPIVEEELAILGEVNSRLDSAGTRREPSEASILEELEHIRSALATAKAEDRAALLQQWDRQSALLGQLRSARGTPSLDLASPYFAHFRLLESSQRHDILLGKTTRMLPGLPIVDWRNAPISRIFYRYRQGEEYEEEIAGRERSGVVAARRTVVIRERRLERVESPEGVFRALAGVAGEWQQSATESPRLAGGQGAAIRAREIHAGEHVHLGTGAENERDDPDAGRVSADADASPGFRRRADKHLPDIAGLIDGEQFALITRPSSGVVVIRGTAGSGKTTVALHRIAYLAYDDPAIDSAQTLFVVFSTALRDYVGHVLPGLAVRNVQVRTFQDWAAEQLRRLFPRLPRRIREITPAIVTRLKLHPVLMVALREHVRTTGRQPGLSDAEQAIDDWASALARAELLEALFARSAPGALSAAELRRASLWCRDRHDEINAWIAGRASADAALDAEDLSLLLRAWQLRVGPLPGGAGRPLRYRHVAIDEVQDFSPLEVQVLMDCLDQRRSLTLAGDTQQHILEEGGFSSWTEFLAQLGIAADEVSTLRVSYRCTREIAE